MDKTLYNKEHNLEFWHITKNAMTSIIHQLNFDWVDINVIPKDRKIFCVMRNPIDRMLSSFIMCKKLYSNTANIFSMRDVSDEKIKLMFFNESISNGYINYINEIYDNGYFDSHNISQTYYIDDYIEGSYKNYVRKKENITNYILMDNIEEGLSNIFNKNVKLNISNSSNIPPNIKQNLKQISKEYKEKITSYYKSDTILYEDVYNSQGRW